MKNKTIIGLLIIGVLLVSGCNLKIKIYTEKCYNEEIVEKVVIVGGISWCMYYHDNDKCNARYWYELEDDKITLCEEGIIHYGGDSNLVLNPTSEDKICLVKRIMEVCDEK